MLSLRKVKSSRTSEVASPAPDESLEMVMLEAGTGTWNKFGGGESSKRYATNASNNAVERHTVLLQYPP